MKKLIVMIAAACAMFTSNAALTPTECINCGGGTEEVSECDTVVFKIKGSGKAVVTKDDYKAVKTIKISKGALALTGTFCEATGACCYDSGAFFATVKTGGRTIKIAQDITPAVWSVFGKNLNKVRTGNVKKGKTYKLDSALFIESDGDAYVDDVNVEDLQFAASAFGTVNVGISKGSKKSSSYCAPAVECPECTPTYTPKTYSGWFVGKYACVGEEDCFLCDCADTDVFGGTWKATYTTKYTTMSQASSYAGVNVDDEDE